MLTFISIIVILYKITKHSYMFDNMVRASLQVTDNCQTMSGIDRQNLARINPTRGEIRAFFIFDSVRIMSKLG